MALCNGGAYAEQVPAIVIMLCVVSGSVVKRWGAQMLWSTMQHHSSCSLSSGCGGCWLGAACTQQLEYLRGCRLYGGHPHGLPEPIPDRGCCQGQKRADTWRRLWRGHVSCLHPPLRWSDISSTILGFEYRYWGFGLLGDNTSHRFFSPYNSSEDVELLLLLDAAVQFQHAGHLSLLIHYHTLCGVLQAGHSIVQSEGHHHLCDSWQ